MFEFKTITLLYYILEGKMKKEFLIISGIALSLFMFASCGGGSSSSSVGMFDMAKQVGPKITGVVASSVKVDALPWGSGTNLGNIYGLIKDYTNNGQTEAQGVDGSNMYVAIANADQYASDAIAKSEKITAQAVDTVFDFGADKINSGVTYTGKYNSTSNDNGRNYEYSYAVKQEAGITYVNSGWFVNETTQESPVVTEAQMSADSLKINSAYFVNYLAGSPMGAGMNYTVRIYLNGRLTDDPATAGDDTNLFTLKLLKGSMSIAGYGKAKSGYYIFKFYNTGSAVSTAKYFCFSSTASLADLQALVDSGNQAGFASSDATNITPHCGSYVANVDAITMYMASDALTDFSQLTGSGAHKIGLAF
jgi:hypothetical protein